jgi:hypothetical protein
MSEYTQPKYGLAFFTGAEHGRAPGPERPLVQKFAEAYTEMAPNPYNRVRDGGLTYPYPGKGVSGETTN